ncbi:MAG: FHA domain-containing protein [bacterium]|nr:FHA domain-containing protein [bacterium]
MSYPKPKMLVLSFSMAPTSENATHSKQKDAIIGRALTKPNLRRARLRIRNHAQIRSESGQYIVEDLDSTNGTFVNDAQIQAAVPLSDGDPIKTGEVIFQIPSRDNLENVYHEELYRLATQDG